MGPRFRTLVRLRLHRALNTTVLCVTAALTEAIVGKRLAGRSPPDFTLVCIYRRENAELVERLIVDATSVRLWALDEIVPSLAELTIGSGPGPRMQHLNTLLDGCRTTYVVVSDDDIEFTTGSISRVVLLAARQRLDLCQPSHDRRGNPSHWITVQRPMSALRLTNFVEIGPLFVVGPERRSEFLPFPEDSPLGWGLDVRWMKLANEQRARLGIVDCASVVHLNPYGGSYDTDEAETHLNTALSDTGLESIPRAARADSIVRPWRA